MSDENNQLANRTPGTLGFGNDRIAQAVELALVTGDLSKLTSEQRVRHYVCLCESLDLNPASRPFEYITLQGKLTLYANKGCAEQLRANRKISILIEKEWESDGLFYVRVTASSGDGRTDQATGYAVVKGKVGEDLGNAHLKAETKAKRRVTLSLCGLGMIDESELEDVQSARPARLETENAPKSAAERMKEATTKKPEPVIVDQPPAPVDMDTIPEESPGQWYVRMTTAAKARGWDAEHFAGVLKRWQDVCKISSHERANMTERGMFEKGMESGRHDPAATH